VEAADSVAGQGEKSSPEIHINNESHAAWSKCLGPVDRHGCDIGDTLVK
jgi:hypothetical protein